METRLNDSSQSVLIVDDDRNIVELLEALLASEGWQTYTAMTGNEAIRIFEEKAPDLALIDLILPDIDGIEICRKIRESSEVPVIIVSAISDDERKIKCLNFAADDYVTKPFSPPVLLARINAVLRRKAPPSSLSIFKFGELEINFMTRKVIKNGVEVRLTPNEFTLLKSFVQNKDRILPFCELMEKLWIRDSVETEHNLQVHIYNLRKKIETESFRITNIYGIGFRLDILDTNRSEDQSSI